MPQKLDYRPEPPRRRHTVEVIWVLACLSVGGALLWLGRSPEFNNWMNLEVGKAIQESIERADRSLQESQHLPAATQPKEP